MDTFTVFNTLKYIPSRYFSKINRGANNYTYLILHVKFHVNVRPYPRHLMRLLLPLLAQRSIPKEPVPFQEILPLKLKATVSGKGDTSSEVCCLQEMSIMLACFKANEFDQALCPKEITNFQKCFTGHLEAKKLMKEREERGILTPGEKSLSAKQVNVLLKRYPNTK